MKLEDVLICIPTKDRPNVINETILQYPLMMQKLIVDGTKQPSIIDNTFQCMPNIIYRHAPKLPLPECRNAAWEWSEMMGCKYIVQVADDTVFKDAELTITRLIGVLVKHPQLWVAGGIGAYSANWWFRTHSTLPYYSTHASCAYCFITRFGYPVRFRRLERSDVFFSLDCWAAGGRVAIDPTCIVKDMNVQTGGCGNPRDADRYRRSATLLKQDYGNIPYVRIGKNGVVAVNFRQLGIQERTIHDTV